MNDQNLKPFQPGNKFGKGRIKGSLNKKTYLTLVFQWLNELDEQERQRKNEIRREKRRAKLDIQKNRIAVKEPRKNQEKNPVINP